MSKSTYFVQECPTCGRTLEVRVEYLGREVACQHCRGKFVASGGGASPLSGSALLRRAEQLLARAQGQRE